MEQPSSTTIQGKHEIKCKNTRKHTVVAKEMEVCRKFLQDESLMKMKAMRRRRIEKGGEILEVYLFSSLPIGLYKEKRKVKIIFDFGEKLPNNPSSSPNHPY